MRTPRTHVEFRGGLAPLACRYMIGWVVAHASILISSYFILISSATFEAVPQQQRNENFPNPPVPTCRLSGHSLGTMLPDCVSCIIWVLDINPRLETIISSKTRPVPHKKKPKTFGCCCLVGPKKSQSSWLMAQGSWLMAKGGQGRLMAHGQMPPRPWGPRGALPVRVRPRAPLGPQGRAGPWP